MENYQKLIKINIIFIWCDFISHKLKTSIIIDNFWLNNSPSHKSIIIKEFKVVFNYIISKLDID
jgi:hypothetical protein